VIPMTLVFANGIGHSNLLIYRKKNNVIEHFEPHGINFGGKIHSEISETINTKIAILIERLNTHIIKTSKPEIKLMRGSDVCPLQIGLQIIEEMSSIKKLITEGGGYCSVWSMFFTELVLKNPTFSSRELMIIIFEKVRETTFMSNYLRRIVIGYVNVIHEKIEKYYSFISGIKKITVDEIIEIMRAGNKNQNEINNLKNDHINILTIHNYLLNHPSVTKEEYLAKLEKAYAKNPDYQLERLIIFLNRINTSLLNPSITKSYSEPTPRSQSNKSKSQPNKSRSHSNKSLNRNSNSNSSRRQSK